MMLSNSQMLHDLQAPDLADPGFPVGGRGPRGVGGGRGLPRHLRFKKFVCQNERIDP